MLQNGGNTIANPVIAYLGLRNIVTGKSGAPDWVTWDISASASSFLKNNTNSPANERIPTCKHQITKRSRIPWWNTRSYPRPSDCKENKINTPIKIPAGSPFVSTQMVVDSVNSTEALFCLKYGSNSFQNLQFSASNGRRRFTWVILKNFALATAFFPGFFDGLCTICVHAPLSILKLFCYTISKL